MHFGSSCPSLRKRSFREHLLSPERLAQGPGKSRAAAPGQLTRRHCLLPNDRAHPSLLPRLICEGRETNLIGELVTICFKSQVIWTLPSINSWKMTFNISGRL